ncbi:tumor necrosis factor ligand superfamily member 10-like isoform X1 [Acipenser oxyrinchus oxyrinchus]|uniref:Tumor necrosis factor ligand superfamily member 10-like isoform X1 n=1 Tax=Acipenser oxyrinchus oxyrinchus TaxID=40147 RepID=A0AAD8CNT4_ACIOX|nr:tumor necrosis factor ligand superfamily member 10-like isoform X1 [Acipenser oxyrinchus oxyrinchus]
MMTTLSCKETDTHNALSCQKRLIHCLLFWVTLLSISQIVTLALLFTWAYPVTPPRSCKENEHVSGFFGAKSKAEGNQKKLSWINKPNMLRRMSLEEGAVTIPQSGLYYLYTQVSVLRNESPDNTIEQKQLVKVMRDMGEEKAVLLRRDFTVKAGWRVPTSGYIGGQFLLDEGDKIFVTLEAEAKVKEDDQETFFGIYMLEAVG